MPKKTDNIQLRGASTHNLKSLDVDIPRNSLVVVSGVSGSGKSSLAFDTLYAEGQRRYVESLSSYARQFMDRMPKPQYDSLKYLPPAVAIEQRVVARNPRSTVATSSEIYDYLRVLMARGGKMISPLSGREVKKHTISDVVSYVKREENVSKILILAPIILAAGESISHKIETLQRFGYVRIYYQREFYRMSDWNEIDHTNWDFSQLFLLIDRIGWENDSVHESRLADAVESAFYEGQGNCSLVIVSERGIQDPIAFSNRFESDGRTFPEPSPLLFNFNSPAGACPRCEGFGQIIGIDPNLVIPDPTRSVMDDCVACWNGAISQSWKYEFIKRIDPSEFDIYKPYNRLSEKEKEMLWHGRLASQEKKTIYGIDQYFEKVAEKKYQVQNRVQIARFSGKTTCPHCKGSRLREEALWVQYKGMNIAQILQMTIDEALDRFRKIQQEEIGNPLSERVLREIVNRLEVLHNVGVGYLSLDRRANTLSGGESQRINLSTRLGNGLVGAMYVLDEPSIGLHERDTDKLIGVMQQLKNQGNTVIVVEHDERVIRSADFLLDIGLNAGSGGGTLVYSGKTDSITSETPGYTAAYLSGKLQIPVPSSRRKAKKFLTIKNAYKHNLKNISVDIPLHTLCVVSGVSGSGKSTLIHDYLYKELQQVLASHYQSSHLEGDIDAIREIIYVDQNSVGRNSRSNPVTYIGALDYIREIYSNQPLSKQMGYKPYFFSFNKDGGRCENCKGDGTVEIEMQFMTNLSLECPECHGKRFKKEILEVEVQGTNIYSLLNLTINEAIEFFQKLDEKESPKIIVLFQVLQRVGLGYLQLGQSSSTLSGGEIQRMKLAKHLTEATANPTLFIFDEPTTGLHFHDISILLSALNELIEKGHSVVVIEHNMDVIKSADYVIDLGPNGGDRGGEIVATGTPEEIVQVEASITGKYLQEKLN